MSTLDSFRKRIDTAVLLPLRGRLNGGLTGTLSGLRSVAEGGIARARSRLERPLSVASDRLRNGASTTWQRTIVSLRDTLEVPARDDLDRLGKKLETIQEKLETLGRAKVKGRKRPKKSPAQPKAQRADTA